MEEGRGGGSGGSGRAMPFFGQASDHMRPAIVRFSVQAVAEKLVNEVDDLVDDSRVDDSNMEESLAVWLRLGTRFRMSVPLRGLSTAQHLARVSHKARAPLIYLIRPSASTTQPFENPELYGSCHEHVIVT